MGTDDTIGLDRLVVDGLDLAHGGLVVVDDDQGHGDDDRSKSWTVELVQTYSDIRRVSVDSIQSV